MTTGAGVRIGVVDTGVDRENRGLVGQVVAATTCLGTAGDAAACRGSGEDDDGHGTHVAGIVAAVRRDGKGIPGVAPDAHLVVAKAVTATGAATVADVVAGIKWVVDHGARVVNLSLDDADMTFAGAGGPAFRAGIDYAWTHGAVPVLAAGATSRTGVDPDARSPRDLNAVIVGATGADRHISRSSPPTGDARFAVLAPGGGEGDRAGTIDVRSAFRSRGQHDDVRRAGGGPSTAVAYVSGAIALLLAEGYNGLGAVERLLWTADGTVHCGEGSPDCWGLINVAAATAGPVEQSSR
jgi:subtilisin family serine protease